MARGRWRLIVGFLSVDDDDSVRTRWINYRGESQNIDLSKAHR